MLSSNTSNVPDACCVVGRSKRMQVLYMCRMREEIGRGRDPRGGEREEKGERERERKKQCNTSILY